MRYARYAALVVWAAVVAWRTARYGIAFNRELLLVYIATGLIAASVGRRRLWSVVGDWLPFAAILIAYDFSRGAATVIGVPTLWEVQPKLDRWLCFGVEPTVWLQEHLKAAHPPWWEVMSSTVYMSLFIVPYAVGGIAWLRGRNDWKAFIRRFVPLWLLALLFYAAVPAAPPWAAARCTPDEVAGGPSHPPCMAHNPAGVPNGGLLGPMHVAHPGAANFVERISVRGWGVLHLDAARSLVNEGQASVNLVAAIPSVHAGLTAMVALFLWRRIRPVWRPVLVVYVLVMAFALVYSAEHYVCDILFGWVLAAAISVLAERIGPQVRGEAPSSSVSDKKPAKSVEPAFAGKGPQ
ncbi:MAG TPA: phosphatase PAP2 family protein [Mycobacterium sp.]|nr:phosphatase PAP2 family protein [Mycobacterium sp.]